MDENTKQYCLLLSEIIRIHMVVLGPDMAILKAQSVAGLDVDRNGRVTDIKTNAVEATKILVDIYLNLTSQATKSAIDAIFLKYPQVRRVE